MTPSSGVMVSAGRPEPSVPATTAASAECVYRPRWHTAQHLVRVPTPGCFLINLTFFLWNVWLQTVNFFTSNVGKATNLYFIFYLKVIWGMGTNNDPQGEKCLSKMPSLICPLLWAADLLKFNVIRCFQICPAACSKELGNCVYLEPFEAPKA